MLLIKSELYHLHQKSVENTENIWIWNYLISFCHVNFKASNSITVMTVLKTGIKVIVWVYKHSMRKVTCPSSSTVHSALTLFEQNLEIFWPVDCEHHEISDLFSNLHYISGSVQSNNLISRRNRKTIRKRSKFIQIRVILIM